MEQLAIGVLERHPPIELPPLRGATVERIVERVRAPGAHLVENDLTMRFAVGRGPVREALRRLAAEGLIDHFPHRGAWVRRLTRDELRELFQIRTELETLAAQLAATNHDSRARAEFEHAVQPIFEDHAPSEDEFTIEGAAFHEAVIIASGSGQLIEFARRMHLPLLLPQINDSLTAGGLAQQIHEHRAIASAILASDPRAAGSIMRTHLERAASLAGFVD
jgi:DNA-binding GntR family transcriptional regulator